jgi:adenylyltransferase/sulfurtransferase
MLTSEENKRYSRHLLLDQVGVSGQLKLKQAKVLVIGAGGLGCPVLQYLTAAGVGTIGIVDFDVVDLSNLQRQILFTTEDVGKKKATTAAKRLSQLNPLVQFTVFPEKLTPQNALTIFEGFDVVVDGTDNFSTRYLISDASVILNKPLVYGSIHKFEGQVAVFNYKNGPSYRCLFPTPPAPDQIQSCSEVGVLGVLPGIIGTQQANEVLKIILEIGEPLNGKLMLINALSSSSVLLTIQRTAAIATTLANKENFSQTDYDLFCGIIPIPSDQPNLKELCDHPDYQIIDLREPWEEPKLTGKSVVLLPLGELKNEIAQIATYKKVMLVCQNGIRSQQAKSFLVDYHGFKNVSNLIGGIQGNGE